MEHKNRHASQPKKPQAIRDFQVFTEFSHSLHESRLYTDDCTVFLSLRYFAFLQPLRVYLLRVEIRLVRYPKRLTAVPYLFLLYSHLFYYFECILRVSLKFHLY
jgi:hypothetical protein